eukprot:CAMPEP_0184335046 /NCGR_PEP_ID=MMETSP1089-20130417/3675_1 /TAXON_ID=38269 ORGANISM="Gloeochaete wittrockiana, Strain SAG46.84" /NCGR_SAMPLE_ID=MMETSP1089 /ASSEMBLY_ACC=CAM_ASM_000445 /LENGTH=295 /DNA_ID=CAMNT_0026659521 /DNA_START=29 /DNA_END=916 /DNA_ORIENTATION=-
MAEPATPEIKEDAPVAEPVVAPVAVVAAPAAAAAAPAAAEKPPLTSVADIGVCCDRNARHRRTMEDAHVIKDGFGDVPTNGYFAVYDGHGGRGAVEYVKDHLHVNFLEALANNPGDVAAAYRDSYKKTDDEIKKAAIHAGTTTVSVFLTVQDGVKKIYVANVGDARVILCHGDEAIRLTHDHKATDEDEIQRIKDAGGFVVNERVNGILAVSRSLGDSAMKDYVTGDPYTTDRDVTEIDSHIILACDGVWDVISDAEAMEIIKAAPTCQEAAVTLLRTSLRKGSTDNISVMVIKF